MNSDTHLFYSEKEFRRVIYNTMKHTNPTLKKTPLKKNDNKIGTRHCECLSQH